METLSGYNILHTFQELGVDTGNITKNVFEAWFDNDDPGTMSFLNWFCSLNKENVLKSSEYEEFLYLKQNNLITEGEEYEQAITDIQTEYDEIWNCDSNCFEIECLNDELDALHEEQQAQEHVSKLQDNLSKDLLKQIADEKENELQLMIKYKTAQDKCLQLSNNLDEIHENIHMQIDKYSDIINNFKNVQVFISNIPWTYYNQYSHEVSSSLNCYISKEHESYNCIGSIRKTVKRGESHSFLTKSSSEDLDDLYLCVSKVLKNLVTNSVEEAKLKAELKYLKTLNLYEAMACICDSESLQFMLEDNIATKEEKLAQILSQIEQASNEVANKLTNEAKINRFKKQLLYNEKKLEHARTKINDKFLDILTNQELCLMLLSKEKHFMEAIGQFFRDISQYVINNVQSCQKRTENMIDIILKSNDFRQLPIERKCALINNVASILSNSEKDAIKDPIKTIADFKKNTSFLHYNLFKNDSVTHLKSFEYIYKRISLLKSFLMSSPTTCIVVFPPELFSALREVKLNLENQKKAVAKGLEIYNHNTKILNKNKWLRLKRQLWLYFLSEPKKVLSIIEELKKEIESGLAV